MPARVLATHGLLIIHTGITMSGCFSVILFSPNMPVISGMYVLPKCSPLSWGLPRTCARITSPGFDLSAPIWLLWLHAEWTVCFSSLLIALCHCLCLVSVKLYVLHCQSSTYSFRCTYITLSLCPLPCPVHVRHILVILVYVWFSYVLMVSTHDIWILSFLNRLTNR